jgi:4'-phosphopantetheinyl transferase
MTSDPAFGGGATPVQWLPPPPEYQIAAGEVHLWRIPIPRIAPSAGRLALLLSLTEQAAANRFLFERDRLRYIVSHAALRILLGSYASLAPEQIDYNYNQFGKPAVANAKLPFPIRFNLTHSHELALVAFTNASEVGIDVEFIRPLDNLEQLSVSTFASVESNAILQLPSQDRLVAFFNCWTRKEAYIKAVGEGLSRPLKDFEVTLLPGDAPRLVRVEGVPTEADRWSLLGFTPADGYAAALAVAAANECRVVPFCMLKHPVYLESASSP